MELIKTKDSGFIPFDITIKLETPEEARLMFHVMNKLELWEAINSKDYDGSSYSNDVASTFRGDDEKLKSLIREHVKIEKK